LNPSDPWFQLAHPVGQQDRHEHDEKAKGNIRGIHKKTLSIEFRVYVQEHSDP
jgi:hypothetical protein